MTSASAQPRVPASKPGSNDRPVLFLVGALVLLTVLFSPFFFFRLYSIPTGAMEDTLLIGDHLFVRVFPKVKLANGDMVVFQYPIDRSETFIKRVIGMPGDQIRIVDKALYRNGAMVKEPYVVHKSDVPHSYRDNFPGDPAEVERLLDPAAVMALHEMLNSHVVNGETVVPAGKYFVLGDNRDNSLDSRYWGFVDESDVIGKPTLVFYSIDPNANVRTDRFFKSL